ncbi:MAG TPA: M4 family metallopeptidase [Oligoflexia bacterium]|nr:M4 family metallopeptidase [Oligoflexia bacterium]
MAKEPMSARLRMTWKKSCVATLVSATATLTVSSVASAQISTIIDLPKNAPLSEMIRQAARYLQSNDSFHSGRLMGGAQIASEKSDFVLKRATGDAISTTLQYVPVFGGIEVLGRATRFHFDARGKMRFVNDAKAVNVNTTPALSQKDVLATLRDRYNTNPVIETGPTLKIFQDFSGTHRLIYAITTKTTEDHRGQKIYLDAHTGAFIMEAPRTYDLHAATDTRTFRKMFGDLAAANAQVTGKHVVMSADTQKALSKTGRDGYPSGFDLDWYDTVYTDDKGFDMDIADRAAVNALVNARRVYEYYKSTFGRSSYNNKDSLITSVVHVGRNMNNAMWSDEIGSMLYGDGDERLFRDLTIGLDVAGHEMTHGVISTSANLEYAAESGALNESFADFFGKMIDYVPGDWDIGATIMAEGFRHKRRALRNMIHPEEFDQPGDNDSNLRESTRGPCSPFNDMCGVHTNSGIPNKASALMVVALGKEKVENLYYQVLTKHLTASSDFSDMRKQTEQACDIMYGKSSTECAAVTKAFDTVKM